MGSTGTVYKPVTKWVPAQVVDKAKAAFSVFSQVDLKYGLAYRTRNDSLEPGDWALWEAGLNNPTVSNQRRCTGELAIPSGDPLGSKIQVQFGLAYAADTAGTCHGRVATAVSIVEK